MRDIDERHDSDKMSVWGRNLSQIDSRIKRYTAEAGKDLSEKMQQVENSVRDWFEEQELDEKARAEWNELKLNASLLKNKISHRYQELVDAGEIRLKNLTSAD